MSPRGSRSVLNAVLGLVALLACFSFLPRVNGNPRLLASVLGAAAALLVYWFFLRLQVSRSGRTLTYEFLPRKVHYVQLLMHSSIYAYWGWYWREVYHYIPLMAAQLVFAYALDMLVCWSRRDKWILGFGPFPIILSTNLFLWFRDDWFFLQFLLVAVGILGKELIKWQRDGRLTHVFNPSSFPLFIFSIALIATRNTDISSGVQIATTFHYPPHIYGEIFVLGLIVQSLFQVTLVTLSAAASLYLLNLWYTGMTGDYQFVDSNIPVAVFLGLHLLVTDPATSPRKGFGKIVFGALYGAGVFGAYSVLKLIHAPEFYDKLLCVPPLNLTVRFLDRMSEALAARFRGLLKFPALRPQQANFAWMGVWISLFVLMNATGFLVKGDEHPGGQPAYWAKVCQNGRADACEKWVGMLKRNCAADSSRDCLVLGEVLNEGRYATQNRAVAGVSFGRACDLGLPQACGRLMAYLRQGGLQAMAPACDQGDGASCFILGSVFSSGQGVPKDLSLAFELFQKSCEVGWPRGCGRLGLSYLTGEGTSKNPELAISNFEKGCQGHNAASCLQAAQFYRSGKMAWTDIVARERYQRACDLGLQAACQQQALLAKSIPH